MKPDQLRPHPDSQNRSLWERFKARLRRAESHSQAEYAHGSLPDTETIFQPSHPDAERIQEIRSKLKAEAAPKPAWADKKVDLSSINVHQLPINWQALKNLGRAINRLKDDPYGENELAQIKRPPRSFYPAISMVASVVTHNKNPDIPISLPTEDQVKEMKPYLRLIQGAIGKFSENWARKFGGYIEKRGQQIVIDIGSHTSNVAEKIREIENPREEFLEELADVYDLLAEPEYRIVDGGFFSEDYQERIPIEDKIQRLIRGLRYIRDGGRHTVYTREEYPLLTTILPIVKFPPDSLDEENTSIAGAELMEGIEVFLTQEGYSVLQAPLAREVDLFDPNSWMRGLAEWFASEKLEKVKKELPNVLTQVKEVLPESGPDLADKVYDIAENVCILSKQGHTHEEIAQNIFVRNRPQ